MNLSGHSAVFLFEELASRIISMEGISSLLYFALATGRTFSSPSRVELLDCLSHFITHSAKVPRITESSIPFFVSAYSTRGGVSGYTFLSITFLWSSSFSLSARLVALIFWILRLSSLNRAGCLRLSAWMTGRVHTLVRSFQAE